MSLIKELQRRNVLRVVAAYVVTAWLVIQVVETIFPAFGFGDTAIRIVTIVFSIGLIPTVILAWAFELTPDGLKWDSEVDRTQPIAPQTGKKLDRVIMVVLALALSYFAFDKFVLDPARDAAELESAREEGRTEATIETYGVKSIAVIPFLNLSSDPEQVFFAHGVAEEDWAGQYGFNGGLPRHRGNIRFNWIMNSHGASALVSYAGEFESWRTLHIDGVNTGEPFTIGDYTQLDLQYSYVFASLRDGMLRIGCRNCTDKDPPVYNQTVTSESFHEGRGAMVYVRWLQPF